MKEVELSLSLHYAKHLPRVVAGSRVVLKRNAGHGDFNLKQYEHGTIFTVKDIVQGPTDVTPCFILEETENNKHPTGGYCVTRFALLVNPKVRDVGGNV